MSLSGGLRYDRYAANGSDEWLMRIGPPDGPPILFLPPLFEEMNRTRALIAGIMRTLAAQGFGCSLPDLPGTGESERPLESCSWEDWLEAARAAAVQAADGRPLTVASIRGGALLEGATQASFHWRFAPADGASLARDLARSRLAGGGGDAGYPAKADLIEALGKAAIADSRPLRTVRLVSDPREADEKVEGPALWRRSEPDGSPELGALLASDIAAWTRTCAAS